MGSILEERVGLKGAKEPFNYFLLECDPTTAGVSECASTYSGDFWRGGETPPTFFGLRWVSVAQLPGTMLLKSYYINPGYLNFSGAGGA